MPTNTIITATNRALKALSDGEAALAKRTFQDTIDLYVPVSETFVKLNETLKAAFEKDDSRKGKWGQSTFIADAKAAGVHMPSQSTVSRIEAMAAHTAKRADTWRKQQLAAGEGLKFNEYTTYLGKLLRNEIREDGTLTEAGEESKANSDATKAKNVEARRSVSLVEFDFDSMHAAKATKKAKLETLLRMQADLNVQIEALKAEIDEDAVKLIADKVRKAEREAVKAAKG